MVRLKALRFDRVDWLTIGVSIVTLLIVLHYASIGLYHPTICVQFDTATWTLLTIDPNCSQPVSDLELGDVATKLGNLTAREVSSDRRLSLVRDFGKDGYTPVFYEREGKKRVTFLTLSQPRGFSSYSAFLFPLVFWLTGTIAVLTIRPRDARQFLLASFCFSMSIWAAAGLASNTRQSSSSLVFHFFAWLSIPFLLHLHLILPEPLFRPKIQRVVVNTAYLLAALCAIYDLTSYPPPSFVFVAAAVAISVVLTAAILLARAMGVGTVAGWVVSRILLAGTLLGISPVILLILMVTFGGTVEYFETYASGLNWFFLLLLPLWPISYIYALYRVRPSSIEFRANRLIAKYAFYALVIIAFVVVSVLLRVAIPFESTRSFVNLLAGLLIVTTAIMFQARFQALVDQSIYGIRYQPDEIMSAFATRIPQAFNRAMLRDVICDEVLPALMVRQSALYLLRDERIEVFYERGLPANAPETSREALEGLERSAGARRSIDLAGHPEFGWLRLYLTLENQEKRIGWWLFGQRDPDDFYDRPEIAVLSSLANQVAPVIENFHLVEKAQIEIEENRRLQEQLIQSQKMEAIGRLSAGVAHDFNNLLSVILGYSSLLIAKYQHDESLMRSLSDIRDAGNRAASLTKQLLAFSRQQVMEAKVISLNDVVEDVDKMLRRLAGEDIEVVTRLEPNLPLVKVDPAQMSQVILNLAVNARDAMPDGGEIRLETSLAYVSDEQEDAHQAQIPAGSYVVLKVSDTGTGIDEKVRQRIFEPYFTTKEMGKGTGLGLSMVYGIIRQSRGAIQVDSFPGQGTVFRILLPVASEENVSIPRAILEIPRPKVQEGGHETILVVEDEDSVRSVTCEILSASGFTVLQASNGQEAFALLSDCSLRVDLLLTDVIMPHMKGTELVRRVLEIRPGLKILYMSGYNEESILGARLGESDRLLIQKPFQPAELVDRIRRSFQN